MPLRIYTIGSSTRTWEGFLAILAAYGIRALVDVRRFPVSRRYRHFTREHLAAELPRCGISYHWQGRNLGGYRTGGYDGYTRTTDYESGIAELEAIGRERPTAFLCAERLPSQCHRQFIAATLEQRGWQVVHILEVDKVWGLSDRQATLL